MNDYKKLLSTIFFIIILSACTQEGLKEEKTNNENFLVSFLFEYEGIKVYRFYDNGRFHWFTSQGQCSSPYKKLRGKTWISEDEVL